MAKTKTTQDPDRTEAMIFDLRTVACPACGSEDCEIHDYVAQGDPREDQTLFRLKGYLERVACLEITMKCVHGHEWQFAFYRGDDGKGWFRKTAVLPRSERPQAVVTEPPL